jgi:hypothetical protein
MDFGVIVPQGWRLDLVGISDPAEAYETMTRVAQEANALGYHSLEPVRLFAREYIQQR